MVWNVQGATEVQFIMYAIKKDVLIQVKNEGEIMATLDTRMEICLVIL